MHDRLTFADNVISGWESSAFRLRGCTNITLSRNQILGGGLTSFPNPGTRNDVVSVELTDNTVVSQTRWDDPRAVTATLRDVGSNLNLQAESFQNEGTLSPALTAPAAGAIGGRALAIAYNLPEPAAPGSAQLLFTKGGVTASLSLASAELGAGLHQFTVDPCNPAGAPQISAGLPLADGVYAVAFSYQDVQGNSAALSGANTVQIDTTAPVLNLPADLTQEATSANGASVQFSVSASDGTGSGVQSVVSQPPAGSVLALGTTTVTVTGSDIAGNQATGLFHVTVQDTTAPTLSLPASPLVTVAGSPSGATVSFTATASDLVDPAPAVGTNPASGTLFPLGDSVVQATAQDASQNVRAGSFVVRVLSVAEDWRRQHFGTTSNTGTAADSADYDGDGVTNLLERAFGTDPADRDSGPGMLQYAGSFASATLAAAGQPVSRAESNGVTLEFRALYSRPKNFAAEGLTYRVDFSADLASWQATATSPTVIAENATTQLVTVPYPLFIGGRKARFFRIVVTAP